MQRPVVHSVLIVDDHVLIRQVLKSLLEDYADIAVIREATDGEEAIVKVHELMPSIVVMDLKMPRMNGIEATESIKRHHPNVAIVGISVNGEKDAQDAMIRAGATFFLPKPLLSSSTLQYRTHKMYHRAGRPNPHSFKIPQ